MRCARVEYPTGREVLAAYWGLLGTGGLIVGERWLRAASTSEGDPIVLDVHIASLRKDYRLSGRVRSKDAERAVIAFDEGQAQDIMLAAAWADGEDVPERRHRRWNVDLPVRFRTFEHEGRGQLVNISRGGCCVQVDASIRSGARLFVVGEAFAVDGLVRWAKAHNRLLGVEFSHFHEALVEQLVGAPIVAAAGHAQF